MQVVFDTDEPITMIIMTDLHYIIRIMFTGVALVWMKPYESRKAVWK